MFCERLRVLRIPAWRETDDAIEDVKTGRSYASYRVVHRDDDAVYINARDVQNFDISHFLREAIDRYTYVTGFVSKANAVAARAETAPLTTTPFTSAELDRVLNVAQSMGQWAWAYCIMLDVLGMQSLNAGNIVWDGFPHLSRLGVLHRGRIIWLGGAARQTLEYWFVVHGGYHSPHTAYVSDYDNYEDACYKITSPWKLADLSRRIGSLNTEWLPASRTLNQYKPEDGDAVCQGVLYRPSAEGRLLPIGYAVGNDAWPHACERTGWLVEDRVQLLARMAVPLQLREEILFGQAQ
jgi:hypothetical protein